MSVLGNSGSKLPTSLRLSTVAKTIPVDLEDKDGVVLNCYLKELSGAQKDTYMDMYKTRFKGPVGDGSDLSNIRTFKDHQVQLVQLCLFVKDGDEPFTPEKLREFPAATIDQLNTVAMTLNGLNKAAEDDAKND